MHHMAKNNESEFRSARTTIYVTESMMKRIDDYKWSRKIKPQNQAIVELIDAGLKAFEEGDYDLFFVNKDGERLTVPDKPSKRDLIVANAIHSLQPNVVCALVSLIQALGESEAQDSDGQETES